MRASFTDSLIEAFAKFYGYGVIEFNNNNAMYKWALVKSYSEAEKRVIVFVDDESKLIYEDIISYFKNTLNTEAIELIRVNIKTRDSIEAEDIQSNMPAEIIVDTVNRRIEAVSSIPGCQEVINELINIINNINNQNKNSKLYKNQATVILICINICMFILSVILSGSIWDIDVNVLIKLGAKNNELIAAGEYYRLIACMFLHGGLVHIALNMYSLYSIGPLVETVYGKIKYLSIYFVSGITASIASFIFSDSTSIGASGAIFGLLGTTLIFAIKMRSNLGKDFLRNIAIVIAINLYIGFSMQGIDNYGHLGGLLGGIVVGFLFYRVKRTEA